MRWPGRQLRVNTAKKRTHSLLTQGKIYYECIPYMSDARLKPLIKADVSARAPRVGLSVDVRLFARSEVPMAGR